MNVSGSGGAPIGPRPDTTFSNAPTQGTYAQTSDDMIAWKGTEKQWGELCELISQIDAPLPKVHVDVYALAVSNSNGKADSIALIGRTAGLDVGIGSAGGNSVTVGIGAMSAVLSSIRTKQDANVLQHYSAQLVHGQQQVMRSGSQVPIAGDVIDLEGGKTRQSQEYRPVGVNVTINPSIMKDTIQMTFSVEISSVSSTLSSQNINPTFSSDLVQTTLDVKPGTVSFISALAATATAETRERFFFIPTGRTSSRRVSDVVYMVGVSAIEGATDFAPRAACEHGAKSVDTKIATTAIPRPVPSPA